MESLAEIGVYSPVELFATYAGNRSDLTPWLAGAPLNRDRDLRLQYLAGWGINSRIEDYLYTKIMSHRRPPANLFTGSPELLEILNRALSAGPL
jgi:spermidine synthase